jgi:hypothetical protein
MLIYDLLNDTVKGSDSMASNGRIISEYRIGKDAEESGTGLLRGTIPTFVWRDRKTTKTSLRINDASSRILTACCCYYACDIIT